MPDYEETADKVAGEIKMTATVVPDDADHYKLALALVDTIQRITDWRPVYALGQFWCARAGIWMPTTLDALAVDVGRYYGGRKYCRRGGDFGSVARLAANIVADDRFFDDAPIGVAGPESFSRIVPGTGELVREPLTPDHRQRMRIRAEPDFETEAPRWSRLLEHAFPIGTDDDQQRDLLQLLFGGALSRSLWRHRLAVLLLGKTTSGKSVFLNVLASFFPPDMVGATNPQRWGSEYYLAALAGKALNIVGELDPNEPIPGGPFKTVVGCDVIEGRHPTHRPFSFVCTAAHFFNANRPPPTVDRSDAFFKRWRVIQFNRTLPDEEIVVDFAHQIITEEAGAVAAWMLEGAQRLALARNGIPETPQHRAHLTKWRHANNSALQFITDAAACTLDPTEETTGTFLYDRYKQWVADNGLRPFGRNTFYDALDEGAGRIGVVRHDTKDGVTYSGVRPR